MIKHDKVYCSLRISRSRWTCWTKLTHGTPPRPLQNMTYCDFDYFIIRPIIMWRDGGVVVSALTSRSTGREWASCPHTCASVTKNYNLILATAMVCSLESNRGLVESYDSLPLHFVTCRLTCLGCMCSLTRKSRNFVWKREFLCIFNLYAHVSYRLQTWVNYN